MSTAALLPPTEWQGRADAHRRRFDALCGAWWQGHRAGRKQPLMDFLFTYYSFKPARLAKWTPPLDAVLAGAPDPERVGGPLLALDGPSFTLDPQKLPRERLRSLRWMHAFLRRTQKAKPHFGCMALHEWCMLYRTQDIRHATTPLRLSLDEIAAHVDTQQVHCTHYDAFRFFTPAAVPRNQLQPSRAEQESLDQPGCLHVNMDLYKWASKLHPWIDGALLLDCFELALAARRLDMEASPYDLSSDGLAPLPVETPAGRAEFTRRQTALHDQAAPLRERLALACAQLIARCEA